ncbi:hypothetical protein A3A93_03320 [Candidatus Roizmanbacteria bacterium RIFCSPLOWO2_01_FULL_38_12]|uniref:Aldehyde dehydrogenase domain-containing protein n=1 Tax=Candidatus Roizmanbacteria bacterium RIFCSPLOWO2_01_FULL_38_12 TaxID=1802061 RepID=A0A1F7ISM6_9BACT|nr:MAG: hypothetical protein A2861_03985 [Candidatus Roizmanbacteria bacterium RIFCSPHIGHO2_01_FULL_38_15]OGK35804.1 MAG: hypothetical protein A3F59_03610 [Candidatus Roizmanbacteria bacterium RIFCSPHIGHO2_12_FULL_38_13]OGK46377.1 MAG: hypothetical protein A3A93_03320 [Candidatus Roizmanbacteria bacterium RIFCSPLOWO2_01_FULL_38_12]
MNTTLERKLSFISAEFFKAQFISVEEKRSIFKKIIKSLETNKRNLSKTIQEEVKLTELDSQKEVQRAIDTFNTAIQFANTIQTTKKEYKGKIILERRRPRGPILVITPFSSPLSSPAHKIACGLIASTSILFKPSAFSKKIGKLLFEIIKKATKRHFIELIDTSIQKDLEDIVSDERIGIISFTGGYDTGKKIIQLGGVKKYHMELSGGNSSVIFAPDYKKFDDKLLHNIIDGIIAKNGQRCVSIKHLFIHKTQSLFIEKLRNELLKIREELEKDSKNAIKKSIGPLINEHYVNQTHKNIQNLLKGKEYKSLLPFKRKKDLMYPSLYMFPSLNVKDIRFHLEYDLSGPIVFIYTYSSYKEYAEIINSFRNDYVRSGLQLSIFTFAKIPDNLLTKDLLWGGIIINDIPTYRSDFMSFGGFGRAGLGKEGFVETIFAYTDPQVIVIPDKKL